MAKMTYDVNISGVDNGIVVGIGCKKLVFVDKDIDVFIADLTELIRDGREAEITLRKKYFNEEDDPVCCQTAPPPIRPNY